jgi:sarcosine oxidase gamma subunit
MGHAGIILIATGDNSFTIIGRTSFMPYLVALLADASVEYGFEYRPAK